MDRMELIEACKRVLQEWKEFYKNAAGPNGQRGHVALAFDDERSRYLFLEWNWDPRSDTHSALIHLEVRDETVWVHWDGTEQGVFYDLERAGVPEAQIVLAWQHKEEKRPKAVAAASR